MNKTITFIYGLIDPRDGSVFYVGRTSLTLERRLQGHLRDGIKRRTDKGLKIAEILEAEGKPRITELIRLDGATDEEDWEAEQAWIDFYQLTNELTNQKPAKCGGNGNTGKGRIEWTPELLARLGKEPDTAIAKELNVWFSTVATKRQSLGIPAYSRWTPELLARLGKEPDTEISKNTGIPVQAILWNRKRLDIPACPHSRGVSTGHTPWNKNELPEWVIKKLGTMTDAELAKISGFTHRVISSARARLKIPSYAEAVGHPTRFSKGQPHPRWSRANGSSQHR